MLNKVADFIAKHQLLSHDGLHVVALSGGADSVALLRILCDLGYHVEAAHCNFHLRGDESDRDEQFVKNLCQSLNVPLHLIHFDTAEYASLHQVSIEMAARELRYGYFRQLRDDIGAETVCVAHPSDSVMVISFVRCLASVVRRYSNTSIPSVRITSPTPQIFSSRYCVIRSVCS